MRSVMRRAMNRARLTFALLTALFTTKTQLRSPIDGTFRTQERPLIVERLWPV